MAINSRDNRWIETLLRMLEARDDRVAGQKLAACIVIGNRPISFGENKYKTHPLQKEFGKNDDSIYLHAEIEAIANAVRRMDVDKLKNATLYVARLSKNQITNEEVQNVAKPCMGCMRAIVSFGIPRIVYTDENSIEELRV